jgi:hypothetical protein
MERGGNLDQTVKEGFVLALRRKPHGLQRFVRLEKLRRVEQADTFLDSALRHL